ncbi:MAG: methionine synthase [Candidatus Omnitrophica bacterium]|nr:methionine synthase [Candidatus Omnitrophota bacterium]
MSIKGLATGIGSLPHQDADKAVDFVFKYLPQVPFWPQLPKRDIREGMVAQFSEHLPCLKVTPDGLYFDNCNIENELETFYDRIISGDADYFKINREYAEGFYSFYERLKSGGVDGVEFIKCHVTGPLTFAASLANREGVAFLHDEIFMQAVIKGLAMKALWQLRMFRQFGKKMIIFIDEPYLSSFGSAYTPVSREEVVKVLDELTSALKASDVLIGVHCCGNTDWSMFTEVRGIDIINFDAYGFTDKLVLYAGNLKGFFKRGGILCWGIVPTQEPLELPEIDPLLRKIEDGIKFLVKKGVAEMKVRENLLLSPSCGLGTLDENRAAKVFSRLSELSAILRKS